MVHWTREKEPPDDVSSGGRFHQGHRLRHHGSGSRNARTKILSASANSASACDEARVPGVFTAGLPRENNGRVEKIV
jgi:hypothetical protein